MVAQARFKTDRSLLGLLAVAWLFVAPGAVVANDPSDSASPETLAQGLLDAEGDAVTDPRLAALTSRAVVESVSAEELEQTLWDHAERIPALYRTWAAGLADGGLEEPRDERLLAYAVDVTSRRALRDPSVDLVLAMLQLDPPRFYTDEAFRRRVASSWGPVRERVPPEQRQELVAHLSARGLDDFDILETVAASWELIERTTADRRRRADYELGDELGTIEASFLSLPPFLGVDASAQLILSMHRASPERRILVLAAAEMRRDLLAALSAEDPQNLLTRLSFLATLGVDYSPWPRDPLTLGRRKDDDGLHVILRGNVQRGREADQWMGRALIQGLPADLDDRWAGVSWQRAALPFHNGQILDANGVSWVSVHSLEPRILELLGVDSLPVARFATDDGRRYVEAARTAAFELSELRRRPVRFVHALPAEQVSGRERAAQLGELAGGAGIDLDSFLTLLPSDGGGVQALVADLDLGSELLTAASDQERAGLAIYGLAPQAAKEIVADATASNATRSLDLFLERVAETLGAEGMTVRRLPLLWVDPQITGRIDRRSLAPFLINWNNVVLERTAAGRVAEGFASGFSAGDEVAREVFEGAGYELRLHPPVVESIVRNGGFRCSSQHVRQASMLP